MYKDTKDSNFNFFQKFSSIEDLQNKIDKYFKYCDANNKPYTITGLALALDTNRTTLLDWENREKSSLSLEDNILLSNTIRKAKLKIENYAEEQLFTSKTVAGVIFNLKNNWGYVDKQEIVASTKQDNQILQQMDQKELERLANMDDIKLLE